VRGLKSGHCGTTWHGTAGPPCLIVLCLVAPCRVVLVSCSANTACLENNNHHSHEPSADTREAASVTKSPKVRAATASTSTEPHLWPREIR
jgi:hypothetical protein